jgi:hypothetical protein
MAGTLGELNIKIAANVAQLSQDVTKVEREMRKMRTAGVKASKQMDTAAKSITGFKKLAIGVAAVTVAWRTLSRVVGSSVQAFATQENAEKTLATALGETNQALLDQAAALQKVTIFGDEAIIGAQALIGAFVKDEEQIKKATKATLDLAQAKGMDLKAAADLVSKTLGSSTNALSRYGIEVKGAVGSTERLESTIQNIQRVFGGQAAAAAETMAGRIQQMKNAFGDLQEQIISGVAPAITAFAQKMTTLFENMQKWGTALSNIWSAIADDAQVGLDVIERQIEKSTAVSSFVDSWKKGFAIIVDNWKVGAEIIAQGIEDVEARGAAIRAGDGGAGEEAKKEASKSRAEMLQARIDQNAKFIEEEQKLWQMELNLQAENAAAEERIFNRQQERKKQEFVMDKLLLDQKMDSTREVQRAAVAAEQAGLISFNSQKRIAAAMALVNAYLAISQVWAEKSNSVYETVAKVAYTAGQVFGVVSALRGVTVGGGSAPAAPGAPPIQGGQSLLDQDRTTVQGGGGQTTIVFQGGTFIGGDKDSVARDLTPSIEKALEDGQRA